MNFFCCGGKKSSVKKVVVSPTSDMISSRRAELNKSIKVDDLRKEDLERKRIVKGLENLGNSCYISAAIQCLSNTIELSDYMLSGEWRNDINPANPIGTDGQLVVQYIRLLFDLWDESRKISVNPTKFKEKLDNVCVEVTSCNIV